MKNNLSKIFIILFLLFNSISSKAIEQFNFDVTEIEIINDGNIIRGLKRGVVTTNDGIKLIANEFKYNKSLNLLEAEGSVWDSGPSGSGNCSSIKLQNAFILQK